MNEFVCVWFEVKQKWIVILPDNSVIDNSFGAIGYAVNAAYDYLKLGENDFECTEDSGTFYRFERKQNDH